MSGTNRKLDGLVVALDVDGVLLDSERGGAGPWQRALSDRFGIDPAELQRAFFDQSWSGVIVGRLSIEDALGSAIARSSWAVSVDEFLECWFEADFWPVAEVVSAAAVVERAGRASGAGDQPGASPGRVPAPTVWANCFRSIRWSTQPRSGT